MLLQFGCCTDAQDLSAALSSPAEISVQLCNFTLSYRSSRMPDVILTFFNILQVNFITGHNGSGKSALLTGLVVGLGGKASTTSRGSQISGFIQYGKQ